MASLNSGPPQTEETILVIAGAEQTLTLLFLLQVVYLWTTWHAFIEHFLCLHAWLCCLLESHIFRVPHTLDCRHFDDIKTVTVFPSYSSLLSTGLSTYKVLSKCFLITCYWSDWEIWSCWEILKKLFWKDWPEMAQHSPNRHGHPKKHGPCFPKSRIRKGQYRRELRSKSIEWKWTILNIAFDFWIFKKNL